MKKSKLPSPRLLRRLISYDPFTGELVWRKRPIWLFAKPRRLHTREHAARHWNARLSGKPAGTINAKKGYVYISVFKRNLLAHRVIWAIHHGSWPSGQIDHINGNRSDNRIANLRDIQRSDNQRNMKRFVTNKSGVTGVHWDDDLGKWRAVIHSDGGNVHLGAWSEKAEAVEARKRAERELGFHENHGR